MKLLIRACARMLGATFFLLLPALAAHAGIPIQSWTLPGGARVWLVESPSIPMVDVQIDFDGGSRRDPGAQAGLASATAMMLGKGLRAGSGPAEPALDRNQLSEAWVDLGASFGAGASSDRFSFNLRSLTYTDLLERATKLAARQIAQPAWPAGVWRDERERIVASLREAETRPATQLWRSYNAAVYGGHPYGFETTKDTLARIEVADMQAFYERHVNACGARVSIVGALDRAQATRLVQTLLAGISARRCEALPPVAEVPPLTQAVRRDVPFASAQAHVAIGQPGYRRADPDFFALTVGNYVLGGGGFVSRLYSEVREKRGLSYSVYSYFAPGLHAGAFTVGLQTRPDQAAQAVQVAQDVVRRFVEEGPTEAELQAARDNLVGGFGLRIDTNRKLLDNVANIAWNDLPLDYLDHWTDQVARVTVDQVRAAFQRKLQPQRMVTVVVGGQP